MKIERPKAEKRKIHSKNEFELCYLRHQYLRRVDYNPTAEEMAPYHKILKKQAKNTYYVYQGLFRIIGFTVEDLIHIAQIHLVSFLGLFKLDRVPDKYRDFVFVFWAKNNRYPNKADIENKDRANLTMFIKQRMEDVVRVCRQKAGNIKGVPVEEFYAYSGPNEPPENKALILEDKGSLGFKKIDMAYFKSIKKKMKIKSNEKPFQFSGFWYIAVPLPNKTLSLLDFTGADLDPYDNIHNKNPEQIFFENLKEEEFERKADIFKASSDDNKMKTMKGFIAKHGKDPKFKVEIDAAYRFLERLSNVRS